jgi:hypothetical protein
MLSNVESITMVFKILCNLVGFEVWTLAKPKSEQGDVLKMLLSWVANRHCDSAEDKWSQFH